MKKMKKRNSFRTVIKNDVFQASSENMLIGYNIATRV
jgi:hypothetical protein